MMAILGRDRVLRPARLPHDLLRDPAIWAWLFVVLLALIPARAALGGG
jgi:hypothetical protein